MTIYTFYQPEYIALPVSLLFFWLFFAKANFYVQDKTYWCTGIICVCFYTVLTRLLRKITILFGLCGYIRLPYIIFEQVSEMDTRFRSYHRPANLFFFYILKMQIVLIFVATASNFVYVIVGTYPLFQHIICILVSYMYNRCIWNNMRMM